MTINTQYLRDLAGSLENYNVMSRYPQGLLAAADTIDAQTAEIARLREALKEIVKNDPYKQSSAGNIASAALAQVGP